MSGKVLKIYSLNLWLLIFITAGLSAQNVKRGFKLLEKTDFEKSYEIFKEASTENNQDVAALFGISLIYADTNAPYFNLVEAWDNADEVMPLIDRLTPDEIEYIGEYFYNTEARHINRPVKKKIEYAIETIEAKLIKHVREENDLDLVYEVIDRFPDFRHYDNVIHIRNQLEFRKYEKQNTLSGYLEFLQKFPDAAQVDKAVKYRNSMAFENAEKLNTVNAYKSFISKYPDALDYNNAVKGLHSAAFLGAKKMNTIQAMDEFIEEYPDALEISEAKVIQKQLLYEYAKRIHTIDAYNDFIRKYPDGQQYIDIFNLKSLDNGMQILQQYPITSNNVQWARSFDEENNEEINVCAAVDSRGACILGGTVYRKDTFNTDVWILKLSADGKMIWNKYVGEAFNDEVDMLILDSNNDIFGAGHTWLGTDSVSRESWLFKLGEDGTKIWSKSLGDLEINSMMVSQEGSIYLGGYMVNDSAEKHYSVTVLNNSGRKLWSRTYTEKGAIVKLCETGDQQILMVGNKWRAKFSPKGYLIWESHFNETDSIVNATLVPGSEIIYTGFRNISRPVIIKTDPGNKILLEKEIPVQQDISQIQSVIPGNQNQLLMLWKSGNIQGLSWLNSSNGNITMGVTIPAMLNISSILTGNNNLMLTGCRNGLLLIKNNGLIF